MGVGEDKSLGNEISVTIIATGFGVDQQNEISNTEAKKIIHTLEDDQLIEHDLSSNVDFQNHENHIEKKENSFNDNLLDELILTNKVIREIEVIYEDLSDNIEININENIDDKNKLNDIQKDLNNDSNNSDNKEVEINQKENFTINDISDDIKEIEVYDYEVVSGDEFQAKFDFEIPFKKKNIEEDAQESKKSQLEHKFDLKDSSDKIDLESLEEINFEVKGFDDDFIKEDVIDKNSGEKKDQEKINKENENSDSPFESSIDETFSSNPDKRKEKLKEFNYKFKHKITRVDEMEDEPAYKRLGLDINQEIPEGGSRLSLDSDTNEDLQIRSNNSFLHDNVD